MERPPSPQRTPAPRPLLDPPWRTSTRPRRSCPSRWPASSRTHGPLPVPATREDKVSLLRQLE
eukprot:4886139-Heterocapsa_arctica.AAC.1